MNKLLEGVVSYAGVALTAMAIGAACGGIYVVQEIRPALYAAYADAWPFLDESLKGSISEAMDDGTISRWEATILTQRVIEKHGLRLGGVDIPLPVARQTLRELVEASR